MHMWSQLFASKMAGNWWLINFETTSEFYASMTTTVKSSSSSTAFTLCEFATLQVHCVKLKWNCRVLDLHMNNTMVTNWWRYWWGQRFLNLGFCKRNFHSFKLHTRAALSTPKIVTLAYMWPNWQEFAAINLFTTKRKEKHAKITEVFFPRLFCRAYFLE